MKHAVIIAHPRPDSFTAAAAHTYADASAELGFELIFRDLYQLGFDPCLKAHEIPGPGFHPAPDVVAERAILQECDVFALFYPLWLNAPPAILKGYLDRVFGFGFAYGADGHSYNPLLKGRKLISFSSSGAPVSWLKQTGAMDAVCNLFDDYFSELCGLSFVDHVHAGSVTTGASESFVKARMQDVRKAVIQHFGRIDHVAHENQT